MTPADAIAWAEAAGAWVCVAAGAIVVAYTAIFWGRGIYLWWRKG